MDIFINWILAPLVSLIVGALFGYVCTQLKSLSKKYDALVLGVRTLLRQQLIDYHREWVIEKEFCPVHVKTYVTALYEAYHSLGGNGTGTKLYDEIMECPVDSEQ